MYLKKVLIFFTLFFLLFVASGQDTYKAIFNIPVEEFGRPLSNAWAGGLNNPQFYSMDVNGNGTNDLFIFDRSGNKVLVFIYDVQNGYQFTTAYDHIFPRMQHWVVVKDYNCDGIPDLFTANNTFIRLFKGTRTGNDLSFTLETDTLKYIENAQLKPINVLQIDIPAFVDVNNDGDLDILTFSPGGGYMYYFENRSMENNGSCDITTFVLEDECWGDFYESGLTKLVDLDSCGTGRNTGQTPVARHAGSTVLALDMNGDGLKEVILGDISFTNLNLLINGGTLNDAKITSQDINFPSNSVSVDMPIFPAPFFLDINKDGKRDLLVSPNAINNSVDVNNVWYYENAGTDQQPVFQFVENDFLVKEMIDVGTASAPVFYDHNRDGLMDMIIANESRQPGNNEMSARLFLYINKGTLAEPAFELVDTNLYNIAQYNLFGIFPAFGDLNGDGNEDMIIGDFDGKLHYFENKSSTGSSFPSITPNYLNIDVGSLATPQIVDVNKDGKLDLLVGERNGNLNYFENTGTTTSPQFTTLPTNDFFGKVDVRPQFSPVGNSVPYLFSPQPGQPYQLLVGNLDGRIIRYDNIEGNLTGTFTKADTLYLGKNFGERATISGRDINNDQKPELLIGNSRGGVTLFSQEILAFVNDSPKKDDWHVSLYPVPAKDILNLYLKADKIYETKFYITDLAGKQYLYDIYTAGNFRSVNISHLSNGFYIATFEIDGITKSRPLIIQR